MQKHGIAAVLIGGLFVAPMAMAIVISVTAVNIVRSVKPLEQKNKGDDDKACRTGDGSSSSPASSP
jgi:hypothetical protein